MRIIKDWKNIYKHFLNHKNELKKNTWLYSLLSFTFFSIMLILIYFSQDDTFGISDFFSNKAVMAILLFSILAGPISSLEKLLKDYKQRKSLNATWISHKSLIDQLLLNGFQILEDNESGQLLKYNPFFLKKYEAFSFKIHHFNNSPKITLIFHNDYKVNALQIMRKYDYKVEIYQLKKGNRYYLEFDFFIDKNNLDFESIKNGMKFLLNIKNNLS